MWGVGGPAYQSIARGSREYSISIIVKNCRIKDMLDIVFGVGSKVVRRSTCISIERYDHQTNWKLGIRN